MSNDLREYRLPDLLIEWPWPRRLSPYYVESRDQSYAWVESFRAFDPKEQEIFKRCDFSLLASLTSPLASKELPVVRVACDLMHHLFVYDEYTDTMNKCGAQSMADIVMDAFRNPSMPRPHNEHFIGELSRQFIQRASAIAGKDAQCVQRFISNCDNYVSSVVQEADDRLKKRPRNVEEYLSIRRDTCAARSVFSLIEFGLDLPDYVLEHPRIAALTYIAVDLILVVNDLNSYVMEESRGIDSHNIVSTVKYEHKLDLSDAFRWVEGFGKERVSTFLSMLELVPSWDSGGDLDMKVKTYIDGLGYLVRGNDVWSFESMRYFDDGPAIQKHRIITLQPPRKGYVNAG